MQSENLKGQRRNSIFLWKNSHLNGGKFDTKFIYNINFTKILRHRPVVISSSPRYKRLVPILRAKLSSNSKFTIRIILRQKKMEARMGVLMIIIGMVASLASVAYAIPGTATFYTPPYSRKCFFRLLLIAQD